MNFSYIFECKRSYIVVIFFPSGQLKLTSTHYVFTEDLSIVFAKNLRPKETKILVLDTSNKLVKVSVDDVSSVSLFIHLFF